MARPTRVEVYEGKAQEAEELSEATECGSVQHALFRLEAVAWTLAQELARLAGKK